MVAAAQRPVAVEQMRERYESFEPDRPGIAKAEAFTVDTLDTWGVTPYIDRTEGAVHALADWLIRNDYPLYRLHVRLRYESCAGVLLTCIGDRASMLPAVELYDVLDAALRDLASAWGAEPVLAGRMLWAKIGPRLPWSVRYTWDVVPGSVHPRHSYSRHTDAEQARTSAEIAMAHHRTAIDPILLRADVIGPDGSG